jgi:tetratricopeptide (TPR) repeat protein
MNHERPRPPDAPDDGSPPAGQVIHVAFGRGGHVVAPPSPPPADEPAAREPPDVVTEVFSKAEVARLLRLAPSRLRSLEKAGVIAPSGRKDGRPAYTFGDVIALRAAAGLLGKKVRPRDVAQAVENLRRSLPRVTRPLSELRIDSDGKSVVVRAPGGDFEPLTGQLVLSFEVRELRDAVVHTLRPTITPERSRTAYDAYVRASELDEHPDTFDEAEELYRQALALDPYLAIAHTNLGNLCFRRGDDQAAETHYGKALAIEPHQPEAHYNLGYLLLERGQADRAAERFRTALERDPLFADAHFNLAMSLEQAGRPSEASASWRRYLELDPEGTWADVARKHLR